MSELEELQKNLLYKIKAQDIGLASWKGSHGKPQKMFIPTKDYLLSSASGQQDDIKRRNEMMADYMERQNTPVIIQDEYGDPMEYKYHNIPPPDLIYDPVEITIPRGADLEQGYVNRSLNADEMVQYLQNTPAMLSQDAERIKLQTERLGEELRRAEERYKNFSDNLQNNIEAEERQHELHVKYIKENYKVKDWSMGIRLDRADTRDRIRELKNMKRGYAEDVQDIKREIETHLHNERLFFNTMEENKAKIQKELKKNEDKVKTYAQALSNLNKGELNTSKNFNETDEEYVERLQQMASVPFVDRNSEMKALMREKERLRDNLKLIIRDDSTISQVINGIYQNEPLLMYEINKFYPGFQEYFIKKYGVNNDKINFKDIINEVSFYLKRSTDPRVLSGNVRDLIPYQQPPVNPSAESADDIIKSFEKFIEATDKNIKGLSRPRKQIPSVSELSGSESEAEDVETELENIFMSMSSDPITPFRSKLLDNAHTLEITNNGKVCYIKWHDKNKYLRNGKEVKAPMFFLSKTNTINSYTNYPYNAFVRRVSNIMGVLSADIYKLFNLDNTKFTTEDLKNKLISAGLKPDPNSPKIQNDKPLVLGYGIKNADNLPDKVPFGPNILFLKKLFLKNILSIQNKHRTKINGFNNVHVSDNFVKIIMNLLKGVNFTNSELQNLTNNEKLLLDNLLILSELNKKFVTGSSTSSLNQLKKDYEVLIGEIEAGNNNDLLKKKLYNLLMRMVHFGALSQIQALKHYKEILKSHF